MQEYLSAVKEVLLNGDFKLGTRTGVHTIADFAVERKYRISDDSFPLVTTKKIFTKSLFHELVWYLSGQHHIRDLRQKTGIWNAWADENGNLETAYGRFWRRFPLPSKEAMLDGEAWLDERSPYVRREDNGALVIDQIAYVIDTLKRDPDSRRMVVSAWHPANAIASRLPPCHYTFTISANSRTGKMKVHLSQRSCDMAIGVPFNIACYATLGKAIGNATGLDCVEFSQILLDAHIYCGQAENRGKFYEDEKNLAELRDRIGHAEKPEDYLKTKSWIEKNAPPEEKGLECSDHIPGLLLQLSRTPKPLPALALPRGKPLDKLVFEDFQLTGYDPHPKIDFRVAV